ncbi:MAG: 2Fe-2S iron-sulfur cluster-binding protein [Pseudomonadota bacterium]
MVKLIYRDHDGAERTVTANAGETVMEAAIKASIPGIDAECGGACACATCHVYIDGAYISLVGAPDDMEQSMLEFAQNVRPNSRLSCQIQIRDEFDGLIVTTPENQQ